MEYALGCQHHAVASPSPGLQDHRGKIRHTNLMLHMDKAMEVGRVQLWAKDKRQHKIPFRFKSSINLLMRSIVDFSSLKILINRLHKALGNMI